MSIRIQFYMYSDSIFAMFFSLRNTKNENKINSTKRQTQIPYKMIESAAHSRRKNRKIETEWQGIEREKRKWRERLWLYAIVYVFWLMGVRMLVWVCERVWQKSVYVICMRANRCCDKVQRTFLSVSFYLYLIPVELLILCISFLWCVFVPLRSSFLFAFAIRFPSIYLIYINTFFWINDH